MRKRIRNIIRRMLDGEDFYTNATPRISYKEIAEIKNLGLDLQKEHTYGAVAGLIAVYPLHEKEFRKRAMILLEEGPS